MTTMPLRAAIGAPSESRATGRIRYFPGVKSSVDLATNPLWLSLSSFSPPVTNCPLASKTTVATVTSLKFLPAALRNSFLCTSRPPEVAESLLNPATTKKLALI